MNNRDRYSNYIHKRVKANLQERRGPGPDRPADASPAEAPALKPLLSCVEGEFSARAARAVLGREATVEEIIDVAERRANGASRAAILRTLLLTSGRTPDSLPSDWTIVLPRRIDVSRPVSQSSPREEFIVKAYELLLGRRPNPAEIAAQARSLHLWSRSDLLEAIADSEEASQTGGEIILTGLGRRSMLAGIRRYFSRSRGQSQRVAPNQLPRADIDASIARLESTVGNLDADGRLFYDQVLSAIHNIAERHDSAAGSMQAETAGVQRLLAIADATVAEMRSITGALLNRLQATPVEINNTTAGLLAGAEDRVQRFFSETLDQRTRELAAMHADVARGIGQLRPPAISAGDVVVVEIDGFLVGFPAVEWRAISYCQRYGLMEPGVYALFQRMVRPGMVVADVGANVGLYTLLAARLLGGDGRVYSFEPTPATFGVLSQNVQLNGFREGGVVRLHELAVGETPGRARMFASRSDSTHNSLVGGLEFPQDRYEFEAAVASLDSIFGSDARLDFAKIDVEGAEPLVFRGMRDTLARNPQMLIVAEFAPGHLRAAGTEPGDFLDEMINAGLRARIIDDVTGELTPATPAVVLARENTNLLLSR